MRVLIVDDEAPARDRLKRLCAEIADIEVVGEAADGNQALNETEALAPDILLLDIRMPGIDGMEVARRLMTRPTPPHVIFTTAYGEHAIQAFETDAVDYLVKPVRRERLQQAMDRAGKRRAQVPHEEGAHGDGPAHLSVRKGGRIELLDVNEVLYFQADNKYVTAHLDKREELLEESLKQLEELLAERVVRIHRNALVMRNAISGMERDHDGNHYVTLREHGRGPEISRRMVPEIRRVLKEMCDGGR